MSNNDLEKHTASGITVREAEPGRQNRRQEGRRKVSRQDPQGDWESKQLWTA